MQRLVRYHKSIETGLIDIKTVSEMVDLCSYLGMDTEAYLGREALSIPRQESNYKV